MTFVWKHPSYYKKLKKKLTETVPPESGPESQGLNIEYNTVKDVKLEKKSHGRNRQGATKR
jgi:hypothetical protein